MHRKLHGIGAIIGAGVLLVAGAARGGLIVPDYTDSATFLADHPGLSVVNFEGAATPGGIGGPNSDYAESGVTFFGDTYVITSAYAGGLPDTPFTVGPYLTAGSNTIMTDIVFGAFEIDLGGNHTAVGLDVGSLLVGTNDLEITFAFDNGNFFTFTPGAGFQFFGFIFAPGNEVSLLEIEIAGPFQEAQNYAGLDNLAFGSAAVVAVGACCDDVTGVCTPDLEQVDCENGGGRYGGDNSTCGDINPPCLVPVGACCDDATGICTPGLTQVDCENGGGRYGGDNSTCGDIIPPCLAPTGACCDESDGACSNRVTEAQCLQDGWRYGGDGSDCATIDPPCLSDTVEQPIPTISGWGIIVLSAIFLIGVAIKTKQLGQAS